MVPTEELGRLARWRTRARPRPREVPVMRYVDMLIVYDDFEDRWMLLEFVLKRMTYIVMSKEY
jgi:hypothetical protein